MDDNTRITIEKLSSTIEGGSSYIITEYASWYLFSSICWIGIGLFLVWFGIFKFKLPIKKMDEEELVFNMFAKYIIIFAGLIFLGCNIPDLLNPEGIGIHRLINDIKGSN